MNIFTKFFGNKNSRELKKINSHIQRINILEEKFKKYSDNELSGKILKFKDIISNEIKVKMEKDYLNKNEINNILDKYIHEVFAIVRESSKRVLNMRHFDAQIIGGIVLNQGKIAEMKTGEGKTLVATLPSVLNSLTNLGVHIVTVNDYLASRDAEWMGGIYRFLGLSVGILLPSLNDEDKKKAYQSDITYGQNNEFGFDYLRDNMSFSLNDCVQRKHNFAIIDEVDSILIDEARTPLIISGAISDSSKKYSEINNIIKYLRKDIHFTVDEKSKTITPTDRGISKCESLLSLKNLYDPINIKILHHLNQSLRSNILFQCNIDYIVKNEEVIIIDEHTGRLMHGRRWSDGLHQAIEAKENVKIQPENQTLATITFQNLFRIYSKLSGMTGTADTEAEEFAKIYDLDVVTIPTNKKIIRIDENDFIYKSEKEKFNAVSKDIIANNKKGKPILIGTTSIEKSEILSKKLKKLKINHNVLNAKNHKEEASIIAQAGRMYSVTIATNMAGRGTDIILGGDAEFMARNIVSNLINKNENIKNDFSFLTGKPELINIDYLAKQDLLNHKYIIKFKKTKNINNIKIKALQERKIFYESSVKLYLDTLKKTIKLCNAEKKKVLLFGGLRVIGTERHESRRIDNQLRGRSGRQGDPGSSLFYLSLEDNLMRIFGSNKIINIMEKLGADNETPIKHNLISKAIASAQKRVENFHFDSRKQIIEYDNIMNKQRNSIYELRLNILNEKKIKNLIFDLVEQFVIDITTKKTKKKHSFSLNDLSDIENKILNLLSIKIELNNFSGNQDNLMDKLFIEIKDFYIEKEKAFTKKTMRQIEKYIYIKTIDYRWKEHLQAMEHLREGIHFRGYAQKDPKQEYKKEGYNLFGNMITHLRDEVLEKIFKANIEINELTNHYHKIKHNIILSNNINKKRKNFNRNTKQKINDK